MGPRTCRIACWINRSTTVGIPSRRVPPSGFGNQNLLHRLGSVLSSQQLFPNPRPVLLQVARQIIHGHPVDARASLVGPDPFPVPESGSPFLQPAPSDPSLWVRFSPMPPSLDAPSPLPCGLHPQGLKEGLLLTKKVAASPRPRIFEPHHRLHVRPFIPLWQDYYGLC